MSQTSTPGPSSPSRSLLDASTAIDHLTRSLSDYSRVSTPEPPPHVPRCECHTEDSEYTKAWLAVKAKLETRLVLSAEVGQALLQRHEAYVEERAGQRAQPDGDPSDPDLDPATRRQLEDRIAKLSHENAMLEKVPYYLHPTFISGTERTDPPCPFIQRFSQALLNNELAEVSNKSLSADLQELRVSFSRLSAEHARSVGWEARLRQAIQERDDFHQERDNEEQKLRAAETKLASLGDKCAKLSIEVRRLQGQLEEERARRGLTSEEIIHEATQRLAKLQHSRVDPTSMEYHDEVMKLLESLVADKEALKKSNTELQELLSDSREAIHSLQEEAEERMASSPDGGWVPSPVRSVQPRDVPRPVSPSVPMVYGTAPGPLSPISALFSSHEKASVARRSLSIESAFRRPVEPLTPETSRHPLTPGPSQRRRVRHRRERNSSINVKLDTGSATDESDATPEKLRNQTVMYPQQRHRGVQTDSRNFAGGLSPGQTSYGDQISLSASPNEGQSELSSLVDNPSTLGALLERVQQLFNRIAQADARTLTTRLKRQNILTADVGYLSHSTVDGIIAEVTNLRVVFRAALEDDKFTTTCTRRDLRMLLKFFRDIFRELGNVRTTLNDIVLDPSIAPKVREMVLNPKDESSSSEKTPSNSGGGWMAPLSKLFGGSSNEKRGISPLVVNWGREPPRAPSRPVPKLSPATSASATTVNVEFTGTGAGRAVTKVTTPFVQEAVPERSAAPVSTRNTSINVMGIFAGAPRNDSWVVLPQDSSQHTGASTDQLRRATLRRTASRFMAAPDKIQSPLPRNVDAVIDPHNSPEERCGIDPARTLRKRGLSDSSIRTTFLQHGEAVAAQPPEAAGGWTASGALSQTILNARSVVSGATSPEALASPPGSAKELSQTRATSPRFTGLLPDMSSWAAASRALDAPDPDLYVGSVISNSPLRPWDRRGGGGL
ncbi:hypothetical protein BJV78DRAFT_1284572 [Lactifluus subvellereus]|nr:hypothetical protein BJV78DRAFT_1284572 [Lactifluus subvellereus]